MSLHLWEAIHDADVRSEPIFDIEPDMVGSRPPSLQRVLLAAAVLWCRHLIWPSLREIGSMAAVSPSTSIRAAGSSRDLRWLLVRAEATTVTALMEARGEADDIALRWRDAIEERMDRLAAIDPVLRRLPLVVGMVGGEPSIQWIAAASFVCSMAGDEVRPSGVA